MPRRSTFSVPPRDVCSIRDIIPIISWSEVDGNFFLLHFATGNATLLSAVLGVALWAGREVKTETPALECPCEILGCYGFYMAFSDLLARLEPFYTAAR